MGHARSNVTRGSKHYPHHHPRNIKCGAWDRSGGYGFAYRYAQSNHNRPVKFPSRIVPSKYPSCQILTSHFLSTHIHSHPFHLLLQALPPPINPPTNVFLICPNSLYPLTLTHTHSTYYYRPFLPQSTHQPKCF